MHHIGAARHRPAEHRGRDDSESVWRVEELPSPNSGDRKVTVRWSSGEPGEGSVAHQVGCEDLDIHARSHEPFGQMVHVLFNPTDRRQKTLCQLDDSRRTAPYGFPILSILGLFGAWVRRREVSRSNHGVVFLEGLRNTETSWTR